MSLAASRLKGKADSGVTAVELVISVAILTVITFIALGVFLSANRGIEVLWEDTGVNMGTRRCLRALCCNLRASDPDHVLVDTSGADWDAIRLQVPVGYSAGAITWGAEGVPGHFLVYSVVDGVLYCQRVDGTYNPAGPAKALAEDIDVFRDGQKGFFVQTAGDLYTLHVRARVAKGGPVRFRTASSGIVLRNG